mmetsp:Transcript_33025/g.77200  ORF Transcript_33025/g.77200 Transcript_33025/m.77200 type:complete len:252 (+) Transcript_33025:655-1410(+)
MGSSSSASWSASGRSGSEGSESCEGEGARLREKETEGKETEAERETVRRKAPSTLEPREWAPCGVGDVLSSDSSSSARSDETASSCALAPWGVVESLTETSERVSKCSHLSGGGGPSAAAGRTPDERAERGLAVARRKLKWCRVSSSAEQTSSMSLSSTMVRHIQSPEELSRPSSPWATNRRHGCSMSTSSRNCCCTCTRRAKLSDSRLLSLIKPTTTRSFPTASHSAEPPPPPPPASSATALAAASTRSK